MRWDLARALCRIVAWLLVVAIVALSVVPASARPVTTVGHNFEHLIIFALTGFAFELGYSRHTWPLLFTMPGFAAFVEVVQLAVPGRHARLMDFLVDASAALAGVVVAYLMLLLAPQIDARASL